MSSLLFWAVVIAVAGLGIAGAVLMARAYASGSSPSELLFGAKRDPRLAVVEHATLDGRRKLVLVRRDDVEHLIMIGGPVDVVVETGIAAQTPIHAPKQAAGAESAAGAATAPSWGFRREDPTLDASNAGPSLPDISAER